MKSYYFIYPQNPTKSYHPIRTSTPIFTVYFATVITIFQTIFIITTIIKVNATVVTITITVNQFVAIIIQNPY